MGGVRKLLTEKENSDAATTKNRLEAVISFETVFPAHKRPDFTFYDIKITILLIGSYNSLMKRWASSL